MSASGKTQPTSKPTWWETVGLLLCNARRRAYGRRQRAQQLLNQRAGRSTSNFSALGYFFSALLYIVVNVLSAFMMILAVGSGQRAEVEQQGKIIVSREFYLYALQMAPGGGGYNDAGELRKPLNPKSLDAQVVSREAKSIAANYGGLQSEIENKLRSAVAAKGIIGLT